MTSTILSYNGSQDGIRFGHITFGQAKRSFWFDRLNGSLRLYIAWSGNGGIAEPDHDPDRLEQARAAILAREPII